MTLEPVGTTDDFASCVEATRSILVEVRASGRIVDWLDSERSRVANQKPTFVVAGETGRGKSMFVNALLGRRGLSPSHFGAVTSRPIKFGHANDDFAQIEFADSKKMIVPLKELVSWVTQITDRMEGDADGPMIPSDAGQAQGSQNVTSAYVAIQHPLLQNLTLVDTPGVGGLNSEHRAMTLLLMGQADGLVLVVDASRPITASELAFLRRVSQRIEHVLIAITKIDRYHGWRVIERENRRLLAEHVPALARARIVPVSSVHCLDVPTARGRQESGFAQMDALVSSQLMGGIAALGRANMARYCMTLLASVDRELHVMVSGATSAGTLSALNSERERLASFKSSTAGSRVRAKAMFDEMARDGQDKLRLQMADLAFRFGEELKMGKTPDPGEFATRLQCEVESMAVELEQDQVDGTLATVRELINQVDQGDLDKILSESAALSSEWRSALPTITRRPGAAERYADFNSFRGGMMTMSAFGGMQMLVHPVLYAVGLTNPVAAVLLSLSAGAAVMRWGRRASSAAAELAELRSWVPTQTQRARLELGRALERELDRRRVAAIDFVEAHIVAKTRELEALLASATAAHEKALRGGVVSQAELLAQRADISRVQERLGQVIAQSKTMKSLGPAALEPANADLN